jgi:hypothetical protein
MPGFFLHVGAVVQCSHGGVAQPLVPYPRVRVSGQPIVLQTSPYAIAGCPVPPPPFGNGPDVVGTWTSGSVRVKANGIPVLLRDSQSVCTTTGNPMIIVLTQFRVKGT